MEDVRCARGDVAQLGERRLCKPEVAGSIPVISTSNVECGAEGLRCAAQSPSRDTNGAARRIVGLLRSLKSE